MSHDIDPVPRLARRDLKSGLLLIAIGGGIVWGGTHYQIGEIAAMGPGFFPVMLGAILMVLGVLLLVTPDLGGAEGPVEDGPSPADLRGWSFIIGGLVAFLVLGRYGGLVPATFALVFLSALGDRRNTVRGAALLGAVMTVITVVLFSLLVRISFPLFVWGA